MSSAVNKSDASLFSTSGHSFFIFSLMGDFEKKWSRGDEIKIKIKPKNLYSRYTKYKKKVTPSPKKFFFQLSLFC